MKSLRIAVAMLTLASFGTLFAADTHSDSSTDTSKAKKHKKHKKSDSSATTAPAK